MFSHSMHRALCLWTVPPPGQRQNPEALQVYSTSRGASGCASTVQAGALVRPRTARVLPRSAVWRTPPAVFCCRRQGVPCTIHLPKYACPSTFHPWSIIILPCDVQAVGQWHTSPYSDNRPHISHAGENGGRSDTRWVALSDESGAGFAAISLTSPMQIMATRSGLPPL